MAGVRRCARKYMCAGAANSIACTRDVMRVPKAGCQGRTRNCERAMAGHRTRIVRSRRRMPGGDRETREFETRCPHRWRCVIPVLYARDRIASREASAGLPAGEGRDQVEARRQSIFQFSPRQDRSPTIMLALHGLLVIAACRITAAMPPAPAKAVYDQRQTGDLNVQIELKNLQVIALVNSELLDDYTDYDYFYDYADFTVKPGIRPTTSSVITEKNNITQVSEPFPSQNSTVSASADNTSPSTSGTLSIDEGVPNADPSNDTANDTTLSKDEGILIIDPSNGTASSTPDADKDKDRPSEEEDGAEIALSTTAKPVHALRSQKRCKSGYVPNGDGRCRRVSRPWLTRLLP